jgi:DNA-binding NarL/FixJ family response regulator
MRRLLIVDDHAGFRRAAREALEDEGYAVVGEAGTGAEALASVDRLQPDVILLDVQLPDMTGFQVADRLTGPAPLIVLISSRPASEYRQRLTTTSAAGFIPKEDLTAAAIERVLEQSAQ